MWCETAEVQPPVHHDGTNTSSCCGCVTHDAHWVLCPFHNTSAVCLLRTLTCWRSWPWAVRVDHQQSGNQRWQQQPHGGHTEPPDVLCRDNQHFSQVSCHICSLCMFYFCFIVFLKHSDAWHKPQHCTQASLTVLIMQHLLVFLHHHVRKPQQDEELSAEAARLISGLPDLSFMRAKVLMFPSILIPKE